MLRLKNLANKYQKRTCRPLYANTQATPYAAQLYVDPAGTYGFRTTAGVLKFPANVIDGQKVSGSLPAGTVMARIKGTDQVTVATGANNEEPFGLLANFVGGDLDEGFAGDSLQNQVGVWRGPDSSFEVLAPAFGTVTITDGVSGNEKVSNAYAGGTLLYASAAGQLTTTRVDTSSVPVARLVEKVGSSRIVVDLLV